MMSQLCQHYIVISQFKEKITNVSIKRVFLTTHAKNYENMFKFAKDILKISYTLFLSRDGMVEECSV